MSLEEYPKSARVLDILIGLIIVFLGAWIILDTSIVEPTIIFLLALGLVFIGFTRIGKGILMSDLKKGTRAIKIVTGLIAIVLATAALYFTELAITVLITLLTFGIMFLGLARIAVGYLEEDIKKGTRIFFIVGGGIVFIFGFIAAIFPSLGLYTLKIILAVTFLILGSIRITSGATGELR
ncbi:hypothetical protein EU527_19485 [Candidatus Thorarchaeota archaeon]|nr:MAG: hypothetical protein EU527_19485 [Candidatus Thorarchaeota archaeon]